MLYLCNIKSLSNMKTRIQTRNDSFRRAALALLGRHMLAGERLTRKQLIEKTLAQRPPSYFVNADQASLMLTVLERNPAFTPTTERHAMWLEIRDRVKELMEGPRRLKRFKALAFVLNFTQPSRYFISPKTADRIIGSTIRSARYAVAVRQ